MTFSGCKYKWSNGQDREANLQELLDKSFCLVEGRLMFSAIQVCHLISSMSNNCPTLLGLDGFSGRNIQFGKRFHFEAIWTKEIECEHIIKNVWNSVCDGLIHLHHVSSRLVTCVNKLGIWNKYNFKQITHELNHCHCSSESIKLASFSTENFHRVRAIETRINGLL